MRKTHFTTVITQEGKWYVARCLELAVVSQGRSIENAQKNLQEAVELYLSGLPRARRLASQIAPIVTSIEVALT